MVKVSITLPNTTQITLESEEPEIIHEVVALALRDLPNELMQSNLNADAGASQPQVLEKGTSVAVGSAVTSPDVSRSSTATTPSAISGDGVTAPGPEAAPGIPRTTESDRAFAEFCRTANPLGDMRRVVVAAEGANRLLGMDSVDATDLATLFSLAGWRLPHNFTQTLRNAARDKFRWLERVPGRSGQYSATDVGRAVTLGQ